MPASASPPDYYAAISDLLDRLHAARSVLATREAELFRLKGPCSSALSGPCPLHYAHSGPCDVGGRRREGKF